MITLKQILSQIPTGDWLFSLDLKENQILSHPDSPPSQMILEIRLQGSGLSVHCPSLWTVSGPPHIYEMHECSFFPFKTDGNPHLHLFI